MTSPESSSLGDSLGTPLESCPLAGSDGAFRVNEFMASRLDAVPMCEYLSTIFRLLHPKTAN